MHIHGSSSKGTQKSSPAAPLLSGLINVQLSGNTKYRYGEVMLSQFIYWAAQAKLPLNRSLTVPSPAVYRDNIALL